MSTASTYLTHRIHCSIVSPEDRLVEVGEIPTCGDCRQAFFDGYCPGFRLWDVTTDDGQTRRLAADHEDTVRWIAGLDMATGAKVREVTEVVAVGDNPAADAWKIARDW